MNADTETGSRPGQPFRLLKFPPRQVQSVTSSQEMVRAIKYLTYLSTSPNRHTWPFVLNFLGNLVARTGGAR